MTDKELAAAIEAAGFQMADARLLQPSDLIDCKVALRRNGEQRMLDLSRVSAREADFLLAEARDEGWEFVRTIHPPKPFLERLGFRRAAAYVR